MNFKLELALLNKKQLDVMREINKRDLGYKCSNVDICYAINGSVRPKFDKIRADAETIINEWKAASTP